MAARILIVEDDFIIRATTCELLRKQGYEVEEAGDGFQALELVKNRSFDLIITDFAMRRVDGLTVVEQIHSHSPELPMILITGYISKSTGKALLKGRAEFIRKPVQFEELLSTVRRLLSTPSQDR
jgi:DNA-binding NtrC family response regulator